MEKTIIDERTDWDYALIGEQYAAAAGKLQGHV